MAVAGSHRVTGGLDAVRHGLRALHARGPGGRLIGRAACRRGAAPSTSAASPPIEPPVISKAARAPDW